MQKIIVIGCPGSGKSRFSKELHKITGLPLVHLDMIWHKPDKTQIPREEFDKKITEIIKGDKWIVDGNYMRTMAMRMDACDTIVLMDFPLELCLQGAQERIGTERDNMPWVEEEFDPQFRQFILDFPKTAVPEIYKLLHERIQDKTIWICKNRDEADALLHHFKLDKLSAAAAEVMDVPEAETFKHRSWSKNCDAMYCWDARAGGCSALLSIEGDVLLAKHGESRLELERKYLAGERSDVRWKVGDTA